MLARTTIVDQFKRPRGVLGLLAGWIMANRPSNKKRNAWAISLLDVQRSDRIVEIGCGPGLALKAAAETATDGFVTGLDHSPLMIAMARRRLRAEIKIGRASVEIGDAEMLASYSNALDKIYSVNVVQFLPDLDAFFSMARAALAPGGRIVSVYQPRGAGAGAKASLDMAATVKDAMTAAGFHETRLEALDLVPPVIGVVGMAGVGGDSRREAEN